MGSLIIYLSSIFLGSFGAWLVSRYGHLLGLIDRPSERSSHDLPMPKGGGVGILGAFIMVCVLVNAPLLFWVPVFFLSLLSLFSDRNHLNPGLRLVVQFVVAFFFLIERDWMPTSNVYEYMHILLTVLSFLFFAVFIVGTANFFNFMDGINGIAGISGLIGFFLVAVYGVISGVDSKYVAISVSIALSCVGFLPFNIPDAKVFMGDVGSVLLGFVFACMVVVLSKDVSDFMCTSAFLFPFYLDELTTMVIRIRAGDNLIHPHRKHIYQLLANECGIAHWKVAVGYGLSQLFVGISVIMIKPYGIVALISVLVLYFYVCIKFSVYVRTKNRLSKL